jgi:5-formyltetrahydrofolate cyclo-ligase
VDAGLVGPETTIVTTVHDLQVVEEPIPTRPHDFHVKVIITPTRTIHCPPAASPQGIQWDLLNADQLSAIPVLGQLNPDRRK